MGLFEAAENRRQLAGQAVWFVVWLIVTGVAVALTPNPAGHGTHQSLGLPPCPSVLFFDRPCPGCGLTTSWTAVVHGDLGLAFRAHPLGPFFYLAFTLSAWVALAGFLRSQRVVMESKVANVSLSLVVGAFLVFGAARMFLMPNFGTPAEKLISGISRKAN